MAAATGSPAPVELAAGEALVRVIAEHRGAYHVSATAGAVGWAELPGRTFHRAGDKRDLPTVGDWLVVEHLERALAGRGAAVIRRVAPRHSLLVRRAAGERDEPQPIAANVDVAFVVTSANLDFKLARLDRYVAVCRDGGVEPVIVLSKCDLVADPAALLAEIATVAPSCDVLAVSAQRPGDADRLRARLGPGRTGVLIGSSGVGKSTLIAQLLGEAHALAARAIRAGDDKGVHTTTHRELFAAPSGELWIDTPGMRELARWVESEELPEELAALALGCRFSDCSHAREPGCAVNAAVARGELTEERAASARKLTAEARARAALRGRGPAKKR